MMAVMYLLGVTSKQDLRRLHSGARDGKAFDMVTSDGFPLLNGNAAAGTQR